MCTIGNMFSDFLTSVPIRIGLFKNAQEAKLVLCSWIVRSPFPGKDREFSNGPSRPESTPTNLDHIHIVMRKEIDCSVMSDVDTDNTGNVVPSSAFNEDRRKCVRIVGQMYMQADVPSIPSNSP
jgi:hypothetical protein